PGEACEALLLTSKARVIATMIVWRRAADDYLLLTEPELGERLRAELVRCRFAARVAIEAEEHVSTLVVGADAPRGAVPNRDYGVPAHELLDEAPPGDALPIGAEELELLRIRARTPRMGREIDDRVLPAEAGLDERAISFTKGCYPGQEPVARLRYRGHANRALRATPRAGSSRSHTCAARCPTTPSSPPRAAPRASSRLPARLGRRAPVAQGIERSPAEAEVACSNHAGRTRALLGRRCPRGNHGAPPRRALAEAEVACSNRAGRMPQCLEGGGS